MNSSSLQKSDVAHESVAKGRHRTLQKVCGILLKLFSLFAIWATFCVLSFCAVALSVADLQSSLILVFGALSPSLVVSCILAAVVEKGIRALSNKFEQKYPLNYVPQAKEAMDPCYLSTLAGSRSYSAQVDPKIKSYLSNPLFLKEMVCLCVACTIFMAAISNIFIYSVISSTNTTDVALRGCVALVSSIVMLLMQVLLMVIYKESCISLKEISNPPKEADIDQKGVVCEKKSAPSSHTANVRFDNQNSDPQQGSALSSLQ